MLLRLIPQLLDYMYTARTAAAALEPTPGLDALKTKARTASDWQVVLEFCDKQVEHFVAQLIGFVHFQVLMAD